FRRFGLDECHTARRGGKVKIVVAASIPTIGSSTGTGTITLQGNDSGGSPPLPPRIPAPPAQRLGLVKKLYTPKLKTEYANDALDYSFEGFKHSARGMVYDTAFEGGLGLTAVWLSKATEIVEESLTGVTLLGGVAFSLLELEKITYYGVLAQE